MSINTPNIKPLSYRQKQAIRFWIQNGRRSKADALRKANYSKSTIRQPHRVFNSPAVRRELDLLGHGYDGLSNGLKPKEVIPIVVKKETIKPVLDISKLTEEEVIKLRDLLEKTPPRNPVISIQPNRYDEGYRVLKNSHNHNIFGERLPNRPELREEMNMSDLSSI